MERRADAVGGILASEREHTDWLARRCGTATGGSILDVNQYSPEHLPLSPGINAVAVDSKGNVYVADSLNNVVVQLASNGTLSIVAGNGIQGFSGDGGPATSASLNNPAAVAVDSSGNVHKVAILIPDQNRGESARDRPALDSTVLPRSRIGFARRIPARWSTRSILSFESQGGTARATFPFGRRSSLGSPRFLKACFP